jgi:hypothetical protein
MKNWKTTLFGIITACGVGMSNSDDVIVKTIGIILGIIGPVLFGVSAKDNNVTGGSKQQ